MVDKLSQARNEDRVLKIATYTLQRLIREAPFASEFLTRGGLQELQKVIMSYPLDGAASTSSPPAGAHQRSASSGRETSTGHGAIGVNTLAYALASLQNLMETFDDGWEELELEFTRTVVQILARVDRINVCRPATAIIRKLVVSGPPEGDAPPEESGHTKGSSGETASVRSAKTTASTIRRKSLANNGGGSSSTVPAASSSAAAPGFRAGEKSEMGPDGMPLLPGVTQFGFELIYRHISEESTLLSTLVQRLGSADTTLVMHSLSLLNSLIRHVSDARFDEFTAALDALGMGKAVERLMASRPSEELTPCILEFQSNVVRIAHGRMRTAVTPQNKRHVLALSYIWLQARITELAVDPPPGERETMSLSRFSLSSRYKWRRLGFSSEAVAREFGKMGWLALENCEAFARADPEAYSKIISEQLSRPEERRCPVGRASIEVTEILVDHWNVHNPGYTAFTTFQPFLLAFNRVHNLALRFFLRMWNESGAALVDFGRISMLVRSQVRKALPAESGAGAAGASGAGASNSKTWLDVERAFLESEYRAVRERQMKELESEDVYASKSAVRQLRSKVYRESYEFVRQQRIRCLLDGAWFRNPQAGDPGARGVPATMSSDSMSRHKAQQASTSSGSSLRGALAGARKGAQTPTANRPAAAAAPAAEAPVLPWRFYRLSPNKKYLHYCESAERVPIRGGLDDLPERIDLAQVTDISVGNAAHLAQAQGSGNSNGGAAFSSKAARHQQQQQRDAPEDTSSLVFGLMRGGETTVAELGAETQSQFSEWVDGLSMMRGQGGLVSTRETLEHINALTEIATQIKLLDLTGERVSAPCCGAWLRQYGSATTRVGVLTPHH